MVFNLNSSCSCLLLPGLHTFLSKNFLSLQWQRDLSFGFSQTAKSWSLPDHDQVGWSGRPPPCQNGESRLPCALSTCFYMALWRPLFRHIGLVSWGIVQLHENMWYYKPHWRRHRWSSAWSARSGWSRCWCASLSCLNRHSKDTLSSHTSWTQVATHDWPHVSCQLLVILLSPRSLLDWPVVGKEMIGSDKKMDF